MNFLFASSNKNKIKEVQALFPSDIHLIGLADINFTDEIAETENTIEGNSKLKAEFIWNYIKANPPAITIDAVFADDSGLEVEALNNAPGVYSARYAGEPKNDDANNKKLLEELRTVTKRNAHFKTIITFINTTTQKQFEGIIKGTIAFEPRGNDGFGYDPLFIPQGYRSTFSELDFEIKNTISHRALAVQNLVDYLSKIK